MNDAPTVTPNQNALPGSTVQPGAVLTPQPSTPAGPVQNGATTFQTPSAGAATPVGKPTSPPKPQGANPNSTQNSLLISEVRDGIVIMNDGTFRAVIMCKAINFDLMSPEEREAAEFAYQGFLNSLYFPVQIFIRSQKVDMRPYLEKIDKIRSETDNMLLELLMEDYISFLANIAQEASIMDKRFYVVIQYPDPNEQDIRSAVKQSTGFFTGLSELFGSKSTTTTINEAQLEKAKTELRNRVQAVMQGLLQAGIQSIPLNTQELIELYYDAYNPDTATRQQLKNFEDLTAPVITKAPSSEPASNPAGGPT